MEESKIQNALLRIRPGLEKYIQLRSMINVVNVEKDSEFQKKFNGFYRIRQRPKIFYDHYYSFMERGKNECPTFEETLKYIYQNVGRVEPSFSSKLIATINPNLPIWDSIVLNHLSIIPPPYYKKSRIEDSINIYEQLIEWYKKYLIKEEAQSILNLFEAKYPNTGITDIKKIDFVLWQIRD